MPKKLPKLPTLLRYDRGLRKALPPETVLIGLDEVGRGSLIGPVVAAAVAIPEKLTAVQRKRLAMLDDSKKLNATLRAELSEAIRECFPHAIGIAEKEEVETLNVHHASLLACMRAYRDLCPMLAEHLPNWCEERGYLLLDGKALMSGFPRERQVAIVKGDGLSACIAAASVIAKHYRDSQVIELSAQYPGYGWEKNMGYGTPDHLAGIRAHGLTPHHRRQFKTVQAAQQLPLLFSSH